MIGRHGKTENDAAVQVEVRKARPLRPRSGSGYGQWNVHWCVGWRGLETFTRRVLCGCHVRVMWCACGQVSLGVLCCTMVFMLCP